MPSVASSLITESMEYQGLPSSWTSTTKSYAYLPFHSQNPPLDGEDFSLDFQIAFHQFTQVLRSRWVLSQILMLLSSLIFSLLSSSIAWKNCLYFTVERKIYRLQTIFQLHVSIDIGITEWWGLFNLHICTLIQSCASWRAVGHIAISFVCLYENGIHKALIRSLLDWKDQVLTPKNLYSRAHTLPWSRTVYEQNILHRSLGYVN